MGVTTEFHNWRFRVELERTRTAYAETSSRGAEDCDCAFCRNLAAQRSVEYPQELRTFLESVGIDSYIEAEVWEVGPLEDGYTYNAGWWHFIGEVENPGDTPIPLITEPSGSAKDWQLLVRPGQAHLKLAELPDRPLVQVEFSVMLPWVLDESYPV
jgi:hypothetical protein